MPLREVREMREGFRPLWALVMKARKRGEKYYDMALEVFAEYLLGGISEKEAVKRLRKLAGVDGGR